MRKPSRSSNVLLVVACAAAMANSKQAVGQEPKPEPGVPAARRGVTAGPAPVDSNSSRIFYEGRAGELLRFHPAPGEDQTHVVRGDATIIVPSSDKVDVSEKNPGWYTIVVTHQDGSTDTFHVHPGFSVNLNANEASVTWHEVDRRKPRRGVPEAWERFTLNGTGTSEGNPELATWYEEARAYYTAVTNGSEPRPAQAEWSEFLNQLQWAQGQLQKQRGPWGTLVHRRPVLRLFHIEWAAGHDIWSDDITLDVASISAKVTVERTTDTRALPPEAVIKIVVTDPATGTETTYYVHDHEEVANLRVNTPSGRGVSDPGRHVVVGVFRAVKPGAAPGYVRPPRP